ncbi:leucine-rich repeat domain-containing protein [Pedobacter namyangjuensis]|uniref:leucine-rich repeat domain-containing protein n=1 Tax=Pedobacter namyangjuensis TaxID=600626 RepID=UPI000DE4CAF8|nr:leucine-rich repeat domain-containing protein [Pedobacter namyangjuensis]
MKHHFGDFLDRTGDYWTTIPNRERFAFIADFEIANKDEVKILTITKTQDKNHWEQIFTCPNLEELTLHDPSKEQVEAIHKLTNIKRLRVTFFRATDIEFIGDLENLEEVILEYVSGFSDLTPLLKLTKLKSLHFENLRRVSNFDGLRGLDSLRYLHIDGTLDWNQPIENFGFLKELPNIEVFSLGFIINKIEFPALLPILHLKKLKKIKIGRATFKTNEYAFLQIALPNVEGCNWDLCWDYHDNFEFLGKRAGFVKKNSPIVKERCDEFIATFERMKKESETIIKSYCG